MRGNKIKTIRGIDLGYYKDGIIKCPSRYEHRNRKNVSDSELLRIVETVDAENVDSSGDYTYLPGIISVTIDPQKVEAKWNEIVAAGGILRLLHEETGEIEEFKRLIVGSSHVRTKKALFVRLDIWDQVNEILLCGLDKVWSGYPMYQKGAAKWNAYYGLAYTDSIAVDTPNFVVIPDFERVVTDRFDFVNIDLKEDPEWKQGDPAPRFIYQYSMDPNVEKPEKITPFDGAGLVSVECAKRWAQQLGCDHLPASFQFRAIPGFKGNLYTYDIEKWGAEHGWIITDVQGNEHDIREEKIDAILTKSQTKFLDLYDDDIDVWREEFQQSVSGYTRTFNISEYADAPSKLKHRALSSYQHLQTINFTPEDIETYIQPTIEWIQRVSTSIDEFLRYRHILDCEEDATENEWNRVPPYYNVATILDTEDRELLFSDPFIQNKMKEDLKLLRNRALSGKETIHGNYQVFTPDLYGLAQYAFMTVEDREKINNNLGLLKPMEVYANWWRRQGVEKVAIVRNPHIAMEARIVKIVNPDAEMKRWFRYQETGIVVDSFSTLALALGTADFDGDHVLTTDSPEYIRAVERALAAGDGRTVDYELDPQVNEADISDPSVLMRSDWNGYCNNIGYVVNKVTKLWSSVGTERDHDKVMRYIAIADIIGQLTIDAVKTGDRIPMDVEISDFLSGVQFPYFMRFLKKKENLRRKEETAIDTEIKMHGEDADIESQLYFCDSDTNMNRVCHAVEKKLEEIDTDQQGKDFKEEQFIQRFCTERVAERSDLYKRVKDTFCELKEEHSQIIEQMRETSSDEGTYDYFYNYARYSLLSQGKYKSIEKVVNIVIYLSYVDPDTSGDMAKLILWNAFEQELMMRAERKELVEIDASTVEKRLQQSVKRKEKRKPSQDIKSGDKDLPIHFSDEARRKISEEIRADKEIKGKPIGKKRAEDLRKLMLVLMVLAKRDMKPVQIRYGSSTGISYSKIQYLTGFSDYKRKQIPEMLGQLEHLGQIKIGTRKANPKITVYGIKDFADCENVLEGGLEESKDYKRICDTLLWRFRWK